MSLLEQTIMQVIIAVMGMMINYNLNGHVLIGGLIGILIGLAIIIIK